MAGEIEALAESICRHRFPLLGYVVETGPDIRWRRDYIHQVESRPDFFRRIPYLNAARAGDHKVIWELSRHQHLVLLAQAWQLTGCVEFLDEIPRQLGSWWQQNPFLRGINWTSALEVAYRGFSWIFIIHLAGDSLPPACAERLLNELYRHGVYLEHNLSVYFSPNTHLLGEAVVLHALGVLFPDWPRAEAWKSLGSRIVAEEMKNQVRADGSHFEQSSAYHVYATDLFLFHALLNPVNGGYRDSLRRMADYLATLSAADGVIPLLGDDDGGRLFYPYGNRRRFGAATLATCRVFFDSADWPCTSSDFHEQAVWWCGEKVFAQPPSTPARQQASLFAKAGVVVLNSGPAHIVVDTRAFGHANAGHSHAHALQIICRSAGRDILIDPGTYTYVGEPEWRGKFRGTSFHNTVQIDGLDQAEGAGPFRWSGKPATEILRWKTTLEWCLLDAACTYRTFRHRRLVLWVARGQFCAIVDKIEIIRPEAGNVQHTVRQFWHCGENVSVVSPGNFRIADEALLVVPPAAAMNLSEGGEYGWQSDVPGKRVARPVIVREENTRLPAVFAAMVFLRSQQNFSLGVEIREQDIRILAGQLWIELSLTLDPIIRADEQPI